MSPVRLLTHCQITNLLEVNHQGVACLAQKPNAPNWIVVDCRVSTLGDCSTSNSCKTLIGVHEMHGRMHPN